MEKYNEIISLQGLKDDPKKEMNKIMMDLRHDNMDNVYPSYKDDKVVIDLSYQTHDAFTDCYRLYGIIIDDKIYIARCEHILGFPCFSVYDEFVLVNKK